MHLSSATICRQKQIVSKQNFEQLAFPHPMTIPLSIAFFKSTIHIRLLLRVTHLPRHEQCIHTIPLVCHTLSMFIQRLLSLCCSLELRKGRRRLTWEGSPHSIKEGIQSVISASDCMTFDGQTGAMFTDNSNLAINVTMFVC